MPLCTYCGAYDGSQKDHVIPVSYTSTVRTYHKGSTVPSCRECNVLLGDKMFVTVPDRARYLHTKYQDRYKRLLEMPNWSEEELSVMSRNLQKQITAKLNERMIIEERIEKLYLVSAGLDIWTDDMFSANSAAMAELNLSYNQIIREDQEIGVLEPILQKTDDSACHRASEKNHPKNTSKTGKNQTKTPPKQAKIKQKKAQKMSPFEQYTKGGHLIEGIYYPTTEERYITSQKIVTLQEKKPIKMSSREIDHHCRQQLLAIKEKKLARLAGKAKKESK